MQHRLRFLVPLLVLAGCSEDQPPTGPTESGDLAESHGPGHKVVNSLADPGNGVCNAAQCTLREAINDPASTEITFAAGLTGPITLARPGAGGGTLVIEKPLTITGPGARIVIQRRTTDPAFRIFRIGSGVSVSLTNLTIQGGRPPGTGGGGGIINFGRLALTNCRVAGNSADFGGGLSNHQGGRLELTNSTVAQNSGGGISSRQSRLTLTNSTVARNSGVGISSRAGPLTLTTVTVQGNSDDGVSDLRGLVTLTDTRIVGNSGIGISTFGSGFTLTNSTVSGNSRGGIFNANGTVFTLVNSTVSGNSSNGIDNEVSFRGGIRVTLTNSTVSGNSGNGIGSAFGVVVTVTNSTVAQNAGTGIVVGFDDDLLVLTNSLVAQNGTGPDIVTGSGSIRARFNLIGNGSGSGVSDGVDGNQVGSADAPIDPRIAPLANYGGPTETHRLLLGSPAIDAASAADCPATDQRGVPRPQGAGCDIGSFERK